MTRLHYSSLSEIEFLLTHPVWDVTPDRAGKQFAQRFLLTHPVWDVTLWSFVEVEIQKFLLTHPVWDVTKNKRGFIFLQEFLLTHPVWDVTNLPLSFLLPLQISTHTSRVGCDLYPLPNNAITGNFYSHIPCGM